MSMRQFVAQKPQKPSKFVCLNKQLLHNSTWNLENAKKVGSCNAQYVIKISDRFVQREKKV